MVLDTLGLKVGNDFVLLRFVAWGATRDVDKEAQKLQVIGTTFDKR
jgi:predicted glycosyltransferase